MGALNYGQSTCMWQTSQISHFYRVSQAYVYGFLINTFEKLPLINLEANLRPLVHSTLWKFSTWWKFGLQSVYIFIADWNFLAKFCLSDPSFNENILTSLYLKSETSTHAQLSDYSFIHTI